MSEFKKIADYFLAMQTEDAGDSISNLKLQKLLYYAQGVSLAEQGKPLFQEDFEAWEHGPVIPAAYHTYKDNGSGAIAKPESLDLTQYSEEEKELLSTVYNTFGQYSAWALREMSHETQPWKDHIEGDKAISKSEIEAYFKSELQNGEE